MLFQLVTDRAVEQGGDTNQTLSQSAAPAVEAGKIGLGGAFRLPIQTADAGKIRLGGAFRLPIRRS